MVDEQISTVQVIADEQIVVHQSSVDTGFIIQQACIIFFIGLCFGLFFGILSRAVSAVAGIIKHLIR